MKRTKKTLILTIAAFALVLACPSILPAAPAASVEAASVKINKKSARLIKDQKVSLKISGTKKSISWSSSDKKVASVSSKGNVTAKAKGTATITAKVGKKKYTCKVTVETPSISKKSMTVNIGSTTTLKLSGTKQTITWKSSDKKIATVSSKGKVTGKKTGTATISATVAGKTYKCKVTVVVPVKSIKLNKTELEMEQGNSYTLKATINPSKGTDKTITWKSSNTSVATVKDGKVTAKKPGFAVISASCGGKTKKCDVYVTINQKETLKNITYTYHEVSDGVIAIVKNNNKYPIALDFYTDYYKGEYNVGSNDDYVSSLAPGATCALFASVYDYDYDTDKETLIVFDSFKVGFEADEAYESSMVSSLNSSGTFVNNSVVVDVQNTSNKNAHEVGIAIVFYKDKVPVGYDYHGFDKIKKSDKRQCTFNFPVDRDKATIIPDDYKIFINDAFDEYY